MRGAARFEQRGFVLNALPDSGYRPHVDGLRAIAILLVVFYHAHMPGFSGGYVGVDVFFVISGYLIIGLLCREFERDGDLSLAGFFERRIRRLAPAMLFVLAATVALGAVVLTPLGGEQQALAKSTIATLGLSSNFYFAWKTGGYFDGATELQPLLHTWSLAVEEQFYLFWPLVVLYAGRMAIRRGKPPSRAIGVSLAVVFFVSLALSLWLTPLRPTLAFFLAPTRAWEFAAGGLTWFWLRQREGALPFGGFLAVVGLAAIATAATIFDPDSAFPGWRALIPVLGAVAVIAGCDVDGSRWPTRLLASRPLVWLGLLSYSWYLWHWPLLAMARVHRLNELDVVSSLGICLLALALAAATYRFVENPIRQRRTGWMATRRRVFGGAAAGITMVALASVSLGAWAKFVWPSDARNASLRDSLQDMRKIRLTCWQERPYSGRLREDGACDLPANRLPARLLVWGDSHASHMMPMAATFAGARAGAARIRFMPECPPMQEYSPVLVGIPRSPGCEAFNRDVLAEVRRLRAQGLGSILLAARWAGYRSNERAKAAADAGLGATIRAAQGEGIRVFIVAPVPEMPYEAPACLARRSNAACGLTRTEAEGRREEAMRWLRGVQQRFPGVLILDPLPALCHEGRCDPMHSGIVLFSDAHHLSEAGSMALLPSFAPTMENAGTRFHALSGVR